MIYVDLAIIGVLETIGFDQCSERRSC